jgi:hypothetical protein
MKNKIFVIFICMLLITTTAFTVASTNYKSKNVKNIKAEKSPNLGLDEKIDTTTSQMSDRAIWGLQFHFDVGAASGALGNAGAEYANGHFYTTRWASNLIHEYDSAGNLIRNFSIPNVTGLRDLAYDGQYFYGGAAAGTIYQMDFGATPSLVTTINGPFQCRAIAYDDDLDVFYVSNWGDPVWIVNRAGTVVGQFNLVTTTSTYGFAYDNVCDSGGPYLWVFDQTAGGAVIYQWDLTLGSFTTVQHDVAADFPSVGGIAGGLFFTTEFLPIHPTLGGLLQGVNDTMFCYEMCDSCPGRIIKIGSNANNTLLCCGGKSYKVDPNPWAGSNASVLEGECGAQWLWDRIDGRVDFTGECNCFCTKFNLPCTPHSALIKYSADDNISAWLNGHRIIGPFNSFFDFWKGLYTKPIPKGYFLPGQNELIVMICDIYSIYGGGIWCIEICCDNVSYPPDPPDITGVTHGIVDVDYDYTFNSIDPDGDDVFYYVDWGDGTYKDWFGPYSSGTDATASHSWEEQGTYIIKAKSRDIGCLESDWSQLSVTIPRGKAINNIFIQLLKNHPKMSLVLQQITKQLGR